MAEVNAERNLTLEELKARKELLIAQAAELGADPRTIANAVRDRTPDDVKSQLGISEEAPVDPLAGMQLEFDSTPLQFEQPFTDIDSAMATLPRGKSDAYLQNKAIQLSMIRKATEGGDIQELRANSKKDLTLSPDQLMTMNASQTIYAKSTTNAIRGIIAEQTLADPSNIAEYQGTMDGLDVVESQYQGLLGAQKILADTYSNESPSSRFVREKETNNYAFDLYAEWAEGRNVLDKITDGVGLLFDPMSFTLDANDLVTKINPDSEGDALTNFTQLIASYQVLDPELKQQVLPELINQATKAYDNNEFKVGIFVGLLNDPAFMTNSYLTAGIETVEGGMLLAAPLTWSYKAAKAVQRGISMRQQLKAYGDRKAAIESNAKLRSPVDEAMDADATNWENTVLGTNATDDLAAEYQAMAALVKKEVVEPLRKLNETGATIKVNALTDAEKEARRTNYVESMISKSDGQILNAEVLKDTDKGFVVRYQMSNGDDSMLLMQREVNWTVDDAGSLIAKDQKMAESSAAIFGGKLLSPETLLRNIDDNIVADATFASLQSATIRKGFTDVWKATEKGLDNISKKNIDELLLAGDDAGQVWKVGDLLAGNVQTLSGKIKYTKAEVKAYMAKRAFLDEAHGMQNHIIKEKLNFLGYKELNWKNPLNGIDEVQIGKPFKDGRGFIADDTVDIIAPGLRGDGISMAKRGQIDLPKALEDGYTAVQFLKPIKIDGKLIRFGLLPPAAKGVVRNLPSQILNKVPGYVPRISKPGYYYVKDIADGSQKTVARFKTKQGAQAYIAEKHAAQDSTGVPVNERSVLKEFRDRDFNAIEAATEDANTFGGLYTGTRSKDGIFEGEGLANEVTRMSSGQSIQRMVEAISNQMPMNEYRVAVVERWKNTAKQALKNEGVPADAPIYRQLDSADTWKDADLSIISDNTVRESLKNHRTYMIDSLRIPHNSENSWANFVMNAADLLPNSKARDSLVKIASSNPLQSLKGATFDAYLGWFNPRQLYIQSQNASLAMSMYPKQALGALSDAMLQRVFLYTPTVDRALLSKASKGLLKEGGLDDMAASIEQFKRSGLRDGVMRSGDYGANLGGFSTGSIEGFRKLAGAGRVFFEEGESMARLISWNIARRNWKAANPGKAIDDAAIRSMTDDTLRMNMNMQRENAAWWQKNAVTSVPTQFLQVQAKLVENVVGGLLGNGRWTRKEASMALAGQVIMYGTVGVPLVEGVASMIKGGADDNQLPFAQENPTLTKLLDKGLVGTFFNGLGFENNFSEPASIIAGLDDNIVWDLFASMGDIATGESSDISFSAPSVGVVKRGGDALLSLYDSMRMVATAPSFASVGDGVLNVIDHFAAITSTWSNARKIAYLNKLGGLVNNRGDIMISMENLEDTSFISLMAKAMGIPLDYESAYYSQKLWKYDRKKAEQDTSKALKQAYNLFRINGNLEVFEANKAMILAEYEGQPIRRQEIINSMMQSISDQRSVLDKDLYRFLIDYTKSNGQIGTKSYQSTFLKENEE